MASNVLDATPVTTTNAAMRMRTAMAAVRVSFTWFGTRKSLSAAQKSQAADAFGAEGTYLSAAKKLLDTGHPAFRAVTCVRGTVLSFWRGMTLPFPDAGIRLVRQDDLAAFDRQMNTLRAQLDDAVERLDWQYGELRLAARDRLGRLFNPTDYPESLRGLFAVSWDFPSVEPPPYLQQLDPQLYEQECQRVQARFDQAVNLAEQAFLDELAKLVSHLMERLSGQNDGQPKIFRDSAVENLKDFFERFRHLNIRSNEELDKLVSQVQQTVRGVDPQQLRDQTDLRQHVAKQLTSVQATLDGLLVDRPRRNILRRAR